MIYFQQKIDKNLRININEPIRVEGSYIEISKREEMSKTLKKRKTSKPGNVRPELIKHGTDDTTMRRNFFKAELIKPTFLKNLKYSLFQKYRIECPIITKEGIALEKSSEKWLQKRRSVEKILHLTFK